MADDFDKLAAWQAGDVKAGDLLVRQHFLSIYRFFASKVPEHAEDLTQRTFLTSVEVHQRCDPGLGFRGYLFGIARRVLFDHLRRSYRKPSPEPLQDTAIVEITGRRIDELVARGERELLILNALREIPISLQTVLELHYWEDMSVAEIALVTEVAEGTVKSRLNRGRKMLTERIRKMRIRGDLRDSTLKDLVGWTKSLGNALGKKRD